MPRSLVLGNGSLTVNFDSRLVLREILFPYVGMYNHVQGRRNMAGVWEGGRFSWLDSDSWVRSIRYREGSLVSACTASNCDLAITLEFTDCVHYRENVFLRKVTVRNQSPAARHIRLFFVNDLSIDESDVGDSAYYDPDLDAIVHYKRGRYFCFSGRAGARGLSQFSVGKKRYGGVEGTWRDAEDGRLEGHRASHGAIDSTVSFWVDLGGDSAAEVYYWMCAADGKGRATALSDWVGRTGADNLIEETATYWNRWLERAAWIESGLGEEIRSTYRRSLLLTRAALDRCGGIIASTDTDIMTTNRDHYGYVWPRDAALAARALARAGYPECSRAFLGFASRVIEDTGFYLPKYQSDGTIGPSWHARNGAFIPTQEDETGIVLFVAGEHLRMFGDLEFLSTIYRPLVKKAGEFLDSYRDPASGMPLPSHDLWEERFGVFSWTSAFVCAGLEAAGRLAEVFEPAAAGGFHAASRAVKTGLERTMFDPRLGRFVRGYSVDGEGKCRTDTEIDSSLYGLALSGTVPPGDPRMVQTLNALRYGLWVKTGTGGACRYPNDWYFRVTDDPSVPGNPWIVTTLWLGSWQAALAEDEAGLKPAAEALNWACARSSGAGIFPEQVNPITGAPLSVAPLTWSHSTFVDTVIDYASVWLGIREVRRAE